MQNRVKFRDPSRKADGTDDEEIPFVIAILADLSGSSRPRSKTQFPSFVEVKPGGTNHLMTRIAPVLHKWSLGFQSLDDFSPYRLLTHLASAGNGRNQDAAELSFRLDELLHDPAFERLHAAWLGLDRVAEACSDVPAAKVVVLDFPESDVLFQRGGQDGEPSLAPDIQKALDHLGSNVFGGHAPAALVVDFDFGPANLDVLSALAKAAYAAGTVLIAAANEFFMPLNSFALINDRIGIHHREVTDFAKWRSFRMRAHAQAAFLTLPPVLLRPPYENVPIPSADGGAACYNESVDPGSLKRSGYLWGSAAYPVACLLIKSFALHGWAASISPLETQGLTLEYPLHRSGLGLLATVVGPTFMAVRHKTVGELSGLGLLPIVECKGTGTLAVFEDCSCFWVSPQALNPIRSGISQHLLYWLLVNRLGHSFALLRRYHDLTGVPESELEQKVKTWLADYAKPVNSAAASDAQTRWPIEKYDISYEWRHDTVVLKIAAILNHGSHRSPAEFVIESPRMKRIKSHASGSSAGSFETDVSRRLGQGSGES